MQPGKYKIIKTNFQKYKVRKFIPHLFFSQHVEHIGCGPCTISLLTGVHPIKILDRIRSNHTSDEKMRRLLREHGISSRLITKCEMTNDEAVVEHQITSQHVILISQLMRKNEGSWGVLYDGILYHNMRPCSWGVLELLNRPVLSAYVLYKKEWA